jgi:hypothetical protein
VEPPWGATATVRVGAPLRRHDQFRRPVDRTRSADTGLAHEPKAVDPLAGPARSGRCPADWPAPCWASPGPSSPTETPVKPGVQVPLCHHSKQETDLAGRAVNCSIPPNRCWRTGRCKCRARRPYRPFWCTAHARPWNDLTSRWTSSCWRGRGDGFTAHRPCPGHPLLTSGCVLDGCVSSRRGPWPRWSAICLCARNPEQREPTDGYGRL